MKPLVNDCIKLGFGLMRLPRVGDSQSPIDIEQTSRMVDKFLAAGGKYFDTAFIYQGSEEAARKALVERHPRESYYLATKLNAATWAAGDAAAAKAQIHGSLQRAGCGYFDFYLLHGIEESNLSQYDGYGIWEYMKELKSSGLIRHWGFSFHDSPALLERLLCEHPDAEFVQLQINYADWEDGTVQARANYEVCVRHDVPVVVMEPIKGGTLAHPPQAVADVLQQARPDASCASWALRFVASLEQVSVVLSGMSSEEQMDDNLASMVPFHPLTAEEQAVVEHARQVLLRTDRIPCTACHYCTPGCPQGIHIPEIFAVMNTYKMGNAPLARLDYTWRPGGARASECIQCGQCESACPQHLPIISLLEEVAEKLE